MTNFLYILLNKELSTTSLFVFLLIITKNSFARKPTHFYEKLFFRVKVNSKWLAYKSVGAMQIFVGFG